MKNLKQGWKGWMVKIMKYEQVKQIRDNLRATDNDMKKRQDAFGITYTQINENLGLLTELLKKHIREFNKENGGYWVSVKPPKYEHRKPYNYILIDGKGTYFNRREILTFCDSGFVGFCGEASDNNGKPVLSAFGEWLEKIGDNVKEQAEAEKALKEKRE